MSRTPLPQPPGAGSPTDATETTAVTRRYYFLLRMTNHATGRVDVHLDGFTLEGANGNAREAFATPPVGSPSTRFIQGTRAIAEDQTLRGWVTFDGSAGFVPAALVYTDGKEILRVRFQGDWV